MYDIKDKKANIKLLNNMMLNKTLSMFEYENLPPTLPPTNLEKILQTNGFIFITEIENKIYGFSGNLSGELNEYYEPTKIIINNPYLKLNKEFDLETDGILIKNDDLKIGLLPIFEKYNSMLVENDINIHLLGINSRKQQLISASDDRTKQSAELYIKKLIDGELAIISETPLIDSLKTFSTNNSNSISLHDFLELTQYLKSNLFNEIGLSSNFNMKKERLVVKELDYAEDTLFSLVYTMMKNRISAIEKINEKYNLEIKISFGSVWGLKNKKLVDGFTDNNLISSEIINGESERESEQAHAPNPLPYPPTDQESEIKIEDNQILEIKEGGIESDVDRVGDIETDEDNKK